MRAGVFGGASWRQEPPTVGCFFVPPDEQRSLSFGAQFQASGNCDGANSDAQTAIWTSRMKVCRDGLLLRIRAKGRVETQNPLFDFLAVWIDDKMIFFAGSTASGGGCAMADKTACRVISQKDCPDQRAGCDDFDYDLCDEYDDVEPPPSVDPLGCCGGTSTTSSSEDPTSGCPDPATPNDPNSRHPGWAGEICDATVLAPGEHTLKVVIGTGDGLWHVGAYWDVAITFSCTGRIAGCGSADEAGEPPCPPPYPSPPDGDGHPDGEHPGYPHPYPPPNAGKPKPGPGAPPPPYDRVQCLCDCLLRRANVKFWGFVNSDCRVAGAGLFFFHEALNATFSCPWDPVSETFVLDLTGGDPTNVRGLTFEGKYDPNGTAEYEHDLARVIITADCAVCPDPTDPSIPGSVWTGGVTFEIRTWTRTKNGDWSDWGYYDFGCAIWTCGITAFSDDGSDETCYADGCDGYFDVISGSDHCDGVTTFFPINGKVHIQGLNLHCAQQNPPP